MHRIPCQAPIVGLANLLSLVCGVQSGAPRNAPNAVQLADRAGAWHEEKVAEPAGQADAAKLPAATEPVTPPRKIVYAGAVELVVEDFAPAQKKLLQLIAEIDGAFVAHSDLSGAPGSPRRGR